MGLVAQGCIPSPRVAPTSGASCSIFVCALPTALNLNVRHCIVWFFRNAGFNPVGWFSVFSVCLFLFVICPDHHTASEFSAAILCIETITIPYLKSCIRGPEQPLGKYRVPPQQINSAARLPLVPCLSLGVRARCCHTTVTLNSSGSSRRMEDNDVSLPRGARGTARSSSSTVGRSTHCRILC